LGQPLNTAVELALAVIGGLRHLQCTAEIGYGLTVGRQLLNGFEPENNLQGCVADSLHGGVPGPVWPDEDSHSPWTNSKAPSQELNDYQDVSRAKIHYGNIENLNI